MDAVVATLNAINAQMSEQTDRMNELMSHQNQGANQMFQFQAAIQAIQVTQASQSAAIQAIQTIQNQLLAQSIASSEAQNSSTEAVSQTEAEEYADVSISINGPNDVSIEIFKSLPVFNGDRDKYATWRSSVTTAIGFLDDHQNSSRYVEALLIIRNKVIGPAAKILNNYNTAFNFNAIIDRLDFSFKDRRPLYILEHELVVLQQKGLTVDEFFDLVNEKLNDIVNKINMTYKEKSTAKAFIQAATDKALRTFVTGLNGRKGELLYAAHPTSLQEAYARLQTIASDQERVNFARQYNYKGENSRNPQIRTIQQPNRINENSSSNVKPNNQQNWREKSFISPINHQSSNRETAEAMEVDKSSMNVNVERNRSNHFEVPLKKEFSKNNTQTSFNQQKKIQRLNNVEGDDEYDGDEYDGYDGLSTVFPVETSFAFLDRPTACRPSKE